MAENLTNRPKGVTFNALSDEVFEILASYTAFPWAVLSAQSKRIGVDGAHLSPGDLKKLVDLLADGVGKFTSPEKRESVKAKLLALSQRG